MGRRPGLRSIRGVHEAPDVTSDGRGGLGRTGLERRDVAGRFTAEVEDAFGVGTAPRRADPPHLPLLGEVGDAHPRTRHLLVPAALAALAVDEPGGPGGPPGPAFAPVAQDVADHIEPAAPQEGSGGAGVLPRPGADLDGICIRAHDCCPLLSWSATTVTPGGGRQGIIDVTGRALPHARPATPSRWPGAGGVEVTQLRDHPPARPRSQPEFDRTRVRTLRLYTAEGRCQRLQRLPVDDRQDARERAAERSIRPSSTPEPVCMIGPVCMITRRWAGGEGGVGGQAWG